MLNIDDDNENLIGDQCDVKLESLKKPRKGAFKQSNRLEHKLLFILTTNPRALHETSHISIDVTIGDTPKDPSRETGVFGPLKNSGYAGDCLKQQNIDFQSL